MRYTDNTKELSLYALKNIGISMYFSGEMKGDKEMRLKLIACKALSRELSYILALSPHIVDVTWIRLRCHDTPEVLHELLQKEIDAIESGEDFHTNKLGFAGTEEENTFDAILLGYGLCSNATTGLTAKRHKLVIPRGHDCITLLLGSKERYQQCFKDFPGCYWYTASWIENSDMPGEQRQKKQEAYYRSQDYEEDTLEYLLEELDSWTKNYQNAAYIRMPFFDKEEYQDFTKQAAAFYHWEFHLLEGNMKLLERFISGEWNEEEFLVLEPGETAEMSGQPDIIRKKQ